MKRTVLVILGMRDNSCRERIAQMLEGLEGVLDVDVNLHRGLATVRHTPECSLGSLVGAVVLAGYGAALAHGEDASADRP